MIHPHRVGGHTEQRVSELVYIAGRPRAVLGWIDVGGVRAPVYMPDLNAEKLRPSGEAGTYVYEEETSDPQWA